jgi:[ribosomal protein S5]-alanine N-acetyltransferase
MINFIIETERLIIKPILVKDAHFIKALLNSPKWIHYIGVRDAGTIKKAQAIIRERYQKHTKTHGFGVNTINLKSTGETIGISTLFKRDNLDAPDIGYALLERFENNGYATEATKAVYDYARKNLGMTRILATTTQDNERSIRVLEKLGFSFEKNIDSEDVELKLFAN